jgi:hypothetical protein
MGWFGSVGCEGEKDVFGLSCFVDHPGTYAA